jgi:ADP-dependent NAD(P)H-hydrate dehydratase / NAD(P)H-hydrate epimerase
MPDTLENAPYLWVDAWPALSRDANKYTRGHALILGGYPKTGAARMAARAAARIGAGLTTVAVPESAFSIYAAALEGSMIEPLSEQHDLARLLIDHHFRACLAGPGMGLHETTKRHVLCLLQKGQPVVLDADAISVFAGQSHVLFHAIKGHCVLTPHEGEFARLFGANFFDDGGDKILRARKAAQHSGTVLVLKGRMTVIADPSGLVAINTHAPPTLATAGSGDVLSGMVLGLLAQGMPPFLAACAAVWLHAQAANEFGPGLIAPDLPDLLPVVFRRLLAQYSSAIALGLEDKSPMTLGDVR